MSLFSAPRIALVTAFVDWNSQIHAARPNRSDAIQIRTERTLSYVGNTISRVLNQLNPNSRFDVTIRIYHGWHKGFEPTDARKAMRNLSGSDRILISNHQNVSLRADLNFGDHLLCANLDRIHSKISCHLPNTLRNSTRGTDDLEEKMVDTAIASDLMYLAYTEPKRWLMVLGEDDDLVPPVLTAEASRDKNDGRVLLVRRRPAGPFLKLDGLRIEP